ncbi:MAG: hypothetical protein WBA85_13440 [Brucella anthropi]
MNTFKIFRGSVAWDECRATSETEALQIARARYPESGNTVWVRDTKYSVHARTA